jgi:hypothetical protein
MFHVKHFWNDSKIKFGRPTEPNQKQIPALSLEKPSFLAETSKS